jgi:signal transduction histidine kinase
LTAPVRRISGEGFRHYAPDPQVERIAAKSRDEVGDLSRAFLVMASTIGRNIEDLERAKDELAAYSVSLEHRVEERTAELSEKNRALESALARLKEAQEQIVAQEKLASLGALTAGIAHEIRNPLNFITNFAQMSGELTAELAESIGKLVPADRAGELTGVLDMIKANVAKIDEHGKRADSIVRHMLQHSRGRKGEPTEVAVNRIVREYVGLAYHGMRGQDPSFNAKIEADYDPAAGTIQAVAQDFCRAILNILTNACFALHEKKQQAGEGFTPVLTVSTRSLGDRVEIRIRDNGPGILPEVREKMFEPFFTTKPAGAGTGLGLSITFDIIVAHGGTIQVESEPGQYAEFIVTLPRGGPGAAASPA